jgi:hypothetical protein
MHLTVNEIVNVIKCWDSWYLLQHDHDLLSRYSENTLEITIKPFDISKLSEQLLEDLKTYTDMVFTDVPEEFRIKFVFPAYEYQPEEIFTSIKPVIGQAVKSKITINNIMNFLETDLPVEDELLTDMGTEVLKEVKKRKDEKNEIIASGGAITPQVLQENKEDEKEELLPESIKQEDVQQDEEIKKENEEESPGVVKPLHNEMTITGIIQNEYIEIDEINHNSQPFPDFSIFLEASRLFETVERNFSEESVEQGGIRKFNCVDANEAAMVSLELGTSSPFHPKITEGSIVETDAPAEDLAAVVSFIRYQKQFKLFSNPYEKRLNVKKKKQAQAMKALVGQACSCSILIMLIVMILILWWLMPKK